MKNYQIMDKKHQFFFSDSFQLMVSCCFGAFSGLDSERIPRK